MGPPGTGKSTVANPYGRILSDLKLLIRGDIICKTGPELIGEHVGETEEHIRYAIDEAEGNVLIIDDAYAL
ncbi:hypothetical protein AnigIFM63309_002554 [Aspergillus niger]|nr:hypothetical protein AnigIFM63309_002554 [Aspergillus niger]